MAGPSAGHPIIAAVERFVDEEVRPVAGTLEHADRYPHDLVARMRDLGLFGALVPAEHGGLALDVTSYARVIETLCRGWMSLAGVLNSHTMAALIVLAHGTDEQRRRFLPRFASGQARGGLCLTEPHAGSDVQAIRTVARRRGDEYLVTGTKMFVTNGREGNTFALLALTDPAATPRHRGMSCFVVEKGHPGLRVAKSIGKLGYKGVDTAELVFEDVPVPAANLVGGVEGRGFKHVMDGLETGRINIAARAVGVGQAAVDAVLACAPTGAVVGAPPVVADLATRVEAARLVTYWAAAIKDRGERCDLEAGLAKLWASETAQQAAEGAIRALGERARLPGLDVERLYRDTPLMLIGEGTNEIQRTIIARQLIHRYGERLGALTSREGEPDERRQLVLTIRQVVEKEIVPVAGELEQADVVPTTVVGALRDLGVFGALVPAGHGGLGLDALTYAMLVEELARGWTTVATTVTAQVLATAVVGALPGEEDRRARLPAMACGDLLAAAVLTGSFTARPDGTGWRIEGRAGLVENAARADLVVVPVVLEGGRDAYAVVDRAAEGLDIGDPISALGARGLDTCPVTARAVRVPASAVVDEPAASRVGALARLGVAATALGLAQAAFEAALRYAQQRVAFGKPICEHQAVQLALADMAATVTAARLLTAHAAGRVESPDGPVAASMAKLLATEAAGAVTLQSMRVHGGYGYTAEFPVERYYRDAPRLALTLGGNDAERAALARRLASPPRRLE
jgi:alkylation response protein AidB-like acyl-CoA dehydrogenase